MFLKTVSAGSLNVNLVEMERNWCLQNLLTFETVCKQWEYVYIPNNKLEEGSEESEEPSQKFKKQLQVIIKKVPVGNVLDDSTECFEEIVNHISTKRIQAQACQDDINDPHARVLQIDFTMVYQCKYQNEVQSALWTRGSVNRFTCALYHHSATKTFVICTNYQGKDKFAIGKFLDHLYENEIPEDDSVEKEIIWSDGPSLEFKNKFMRHLMETLSKKYAKPFMWKFSATSHGKGVVDGVGGKVKSMVRRKVMSKGKDSLVVQDCESFVQAAKKLLKSTSIVHLDRAAI